MGLLTDLLGDGNATSGTARASRFITGRYYPQRFSALTAGNPGNGVASYAPYWVDEAQAFDRIAVFVNTAGSAEAVERLAVFNDDGNGRPGTLVVDAGTVEAATTGAKEATISVTLTPGLYWVAAAGQFTTTGAQPLLTNNNPIDHPIGFDAPANTTVSGWRSTGVTGAFAASPTVAQNASCIIVYLRAA